MATTKITDLTAYTDPVSTDVVPIVDVTSDVTKKVSIADLMENAGSGTEALPGISFDGDPDTGIYRPDADQVAISTNGQGRLFVNASGSVGINTASITTVGSSIIPLEIKGNATDRSGALVLSTSDLSAQAYSYIVSNVYRTGTGTNHDSIFITNNTERLRITSTGEFEFTGAGTAGTTQAVYFSGSAPVNSLVVDSNGRLGIGTSSPTNRLQVTQAVSRTSAPAAGASGHELVLGSAGYGIAAGTTTSGTSYIASTRWDGTATNYPLLLNPNGGNVGIGTTSPGTKLEVGGSAAFRTDSDVRLTIGSAGSIGSNDSNFIRAATDQVIYNAATSSGRHSWELAGIEKARIDSSGRLLVGTNSVTSSDRLVVQGRIGENGGHAVVGLRRGSLPSGGDQTLAVINFADNSNNQGAQILAASDGGAWTSGSNYRSRLVFSTTADGASSPTERMRITSGGAFLFCGITSLPNSSTSGLYITETGRLIHYSATALANSRVFESGGNVGFARIMGDGDLENTNNSYGAISDIKLKENIVDATSQWSDIKALQVRKYNFKEETGHSTHTQIGLIAQEAELVSPGLVSESPDCDAEGNDLGTVTKSVNYSVLYMKAVKALQEAMERIETLEAKVAALESA